MSYDLNFYKRIDQKISRQQIANFLDKQLQLTEDNQGDWVYQNEDTGVYCIFSLYEEESFDQEEEEGGEEEHQGYKCIDLTFSINFFRPQFFGLECFPLVMKIKDAFDLHIESPQSGELFSSPNFEILFNEWSALNQRYSLEYAAELDLQYLPIKKSNNSWRYNYQRVELQRILDENYFAPKIFYLKMKDSTEVHTAAVWPDLIYSVLPSVDYLIISKKKGWLWRVETMNVVARSTVEKEFSKFIRKDTNGYDVIEGQGNSIAKDKYRNLNDLGELKNVGTGIGINTIINYRPEG
jgi:hypothetical protein